MRQPAPRIETRPALQVDDEHLEAFIGLLVAQRIQHRLDERGFPALRGTGDDANDRATKALQNGVLTVRGKGGLWRDVELTDLGRQILTDALKLTPRGERCFVEKPRVTHQQIESVQRFIRDHRKEIEIDKKTCETRDAAYLKSVAADGYQPHITFHGLRHAYARRLYYDCLQRGMKPFDARKYVAKRLGHGRDAVTRIYLGNIEFGGRFRHLAEGFRTLRKPPDF